MSASARNLVAVLGLVVGLAVYALVVARVAGLVLPPYNWLAHLAYYAVFGVAWIWPAARLIRWSARGDGAGPQAQRKEQDSPQTLALPCAEVAAMRRATSTGSPR